jgi:two-component system NtrC family sensor kinase
VKRIYILCCLIILLPVTLLSQPVKDSIAVILNGSDADSVKAKRLLGLFHLYKTNEPEQALLAAESAYKIALDKNLESLKAKSLGYMGHATYGMDRYTEALEYYVEALQLYEKLGRKRDQGVILTNMGNIFLDQEMPDQALRYYYQALGIDKELKSDMDIAMDLMNISSAYSVTTKLDSAYLICSQALEKATALKDTTIYAQALGNLGIIEFYQEKSDSTRSNSLNHERYDNALKHITEAEQLFLEHGIESNLGVLYLNLGDIYLERKEIAKATLKYSKALENAQMMESIDDERRAYLGLSKCAELSGNTAKAYDYFKKYSTLNDTIFNLKSSRKQTQLLLNYELDKNEALSKAAEEKKEAVHQAELSKQRAQKDIFIVGFIIVFILSFIMLRQYRQKHMANKKLKEAMQHLEQTQTQLIHQEKMASLGMLTAGIAHEIQNPLNFVTNFSESSMEIIREIKEEKDDAEKEHLMQDLNMNIEKIHHHGKRADTIIKSMLSNSHGNKEDKKPTNINKLCDEFLMLAYHSIRATHPEFNCTIEKKFQPDLPKVNVMSQEITRVMLNLFTNAFHALKERAQKDKSFSPVISIITGATAKHVQVIVRDNGTGIPQAIRDKIFQPFFTTKKSGEGTGLGLSISYDIIKAHGGELKVDSKEGEFTEFTILFPL